MSNPINLHIYREKGVDKSVSEKRTLVKQDNRVNLYLFFLITPIKTYNDCGKGSTLL